MICYLDDDLDSGHLIKLGAAHGHEFISPRAVGTSGQHDARHLHYEAYSLGRNPKFAEIIKQSRESGRRQGLTSLESLENELGLRPRRGQRAVRRGK